MGQRVRLTIEADSEEELPLVVEEITRLMGDGMTSGYYPYWKIEEVQD